MTTSSSKSEYALGYCSGTLPSSRSPGSWWRISFLEWCANHQHWGGLAALRTPDLEEQKNSARRNPKTNIQQAYANIIQLSFLNKCMFLEIHRSHVTHLNFKEYIHISVVRHARKSHHMCLKLRVIPLDHHAYLVIPLLSPCDGWHRTHKHGQQVVGGSAKKINRKKIVKGKKLHTNSW